MSNLMKIRAVVAKLLHADGQTHRQTDMTKLIVAFHNFANALKTQFIARTLQPRTSSHFYLP